MKLHMEVQVDASKVIETACHSLTVIKNGREVVKEGGAEDSRLFLQEVLKTAEGTQKEGELPLLPFKETILCLATMPNPVNGTSLSCQLGAECIAGM